MTVSTTQRYSAQSPCPICDGHQLSPRGQGQRCYGFLSEDRLWGHCTRPEFAGSLEQKPNSQTYAHRLSGDCRCGKSHFYTPSDQASQSTNGTGANAQKSVVATYDYLDSDAQVLFQVVRLDPKGFYQRRPDGNGGWVNNLDGIDRVPFRLPELQAADPDQPVIVAEGEKDVDRLWELGFVATCNPMGAGKWRDEYSETLRGRSVVVIPDNDVEGNNHAFQVAASLHGIAAEVRILHLPNLTPKGDISDYLDAEHTAGDLQELIENTLAWSPNASANVAGSESGLRFTNLTDLLSEPPEALDWVYDRTLPTGGASILSAKPKVGKSTAARNLALSVARGEAFLGRATAQGTVVYLALEEKRSEVQAHFSNMGATDEPIFIHFGRAPDDALLELERAIREHEPILAIIDPLFKFIRLRDGNDYAEVSREMEPLLNLARVSGCHILCVHHFGKMERGGGDGILGSTALFAAVDTALIMRRKDAGRTIESFQRYGVDIPETVVGFDPARGIIRAGGTVERVETMNAAQRIIEAIGDGSMNQTEIRSATEGKTKYISEALYLLRQGGLLLQSGSGKKGDPFIYSVDNDAVANDDGAIVIKDGADTLSDEGGKGCSLVPAIYREQGEQEKQESFTPEEVSIVQPTPQGPVDHREQEKSVDDHVITGDTEVGNADPELRF